MERVFGTLQNRLPQELRLAGIATPAAANRFLAKHFVAEHNARFAVAAIEPGSAFVAYAGDLAEVLCVQVERVVGNDNCVRYEGRCLQIRRTGTGTTSSRSRCGCTPMRTAGSRSSTARAAWLATSPTVASRRSRRRSSPPPKPARRRARWT